MASYVLPCDTTLTHYTFSTQLEGVTFGFEFRWNDRAGAWFMSISDAAGNLLLAGRRVVVGLPMLVRFPDPNLPKGELAAIDTSGQNTDPGVNDLGGRVQLLYTEFASLA